MKHERKSFSGKVSYVSVSPHGDPEGLVLEDGTFIKVPPHSLIAPDLIRAGQKVDGEGEEIGGEPNAVFHHVKLNVGGKLASDDSVDKEKKEALKEKHKKDIKARKDAPMKKASIRGRAVAYGLKPKGEIDRIILDDGTSVHVPKDVELSGEDFEIGAELEIKGEMRSFGDLKFLKAEKVQHG